jgi:uncharacterized membrane protein
VSTQKPIVVRLNAHLRRTFLAGVLATVPVAVTVFIIYWVEEHTRIFSNWMFKKEIPFVGVAVAIASIYLSGLLATTLLGQLFLRLIDSVLTRVPMIREVYIAWKQIALTPGGVEGTFSKVVLIPDESGHARTIGFTSGRPVNTAANILCVYIPFAPNPVSGKISFVPFDKCIFPDISPEEAFKVILSTGNYVPHALADAIPHAAAPALLNESDPRRTDLADATLDRRH